MLGLLFFWLRYERFEFFLSCISPCDSQTEGRRAQGSLSADQVGTPTDADPKASLSKAGWHLG
jgi:hypothetical protein